MGRSEDNRVIGVILKMSSLALFLSFLLATVVAIPAPSRNRAGDCAAADDYIDEVLVNVAKMVVEQGYDPAELPGDEVHFSQDIGFITIHGSARYDQGHFDGLSTIHRTGETQLCVGDNIAVHANIGIRDARAGYHVTAEFQGIEVGASAEAKISSIDIYFEASMALSRQGGGGHRRHHQGLYHPPYRGTHQGYSAEYHQWDDASYRGDDGLKKRKRKL